MMTYYDQYPSSTTESAFEDDYYCGVDATQNLSFQTDRGVSTMNECGAVHGKRSYDKTMAASVAPFADARSSSTMMPARDKWFFNNRSLLGQDSTLRSSRSSRSSLISSSRGFDPQDLDEPLDDDLCLYDQRGTLTAAALTSSQEDYPTRSLASHATTSGKGMVLFPWMSDSEIV